MLVDKPSLYGVQARAVGNQEADVPLDGFYSMGKLRFPCCRSSPTRRRSVGSPEGAKSVTFSEENVSLRSITDGTDATISNQSVGNASGGELRTLQVAGVAGEPAETKMHSENIVERAVVSAVERASRLSDDAIVEIVERPVERAETPAVAPGVDDFVIPTTGEFLERGPAEQGDTPAMAPAVEEEFF